MVRITTIKVNMTDEFNKELCEERHEYLKDWSEGMEKRMQKVSNRFIVLLTGICLNLIGVIILLVIS